MNISKDIIGKRFGKLVVLEPTNKRSGTDVVWKCQCDCGNIAYVATRHLRGNSTKSCGCMQNHGKTHGESFSRLYNVWSAMKRRCFNPNDKRYANYGGRNIKVCEEWLNFEPFRDWAIANGYRYDADYGKVTIDRIDVNGDYEPSNCRFADIKTQTNNTTRNVKITHNGQTKTVAEWSRELGINYGTLIDRFKRGLPVEKILFVGDLRCFS